jgi:5S rRNA maturation endonuclease (ribonuclease M5)
MPIYEVIIVKGRKELQSLKMSSFDADYQCFTTLYKQKKLMPRMREHVDTTGLIIPTD